MAGFQSGCTCCAVHKSAPGFLQQHCIITMAHLSAKPSVRGVHVRGARPELPPVPYPLPRGPYSNLPPRGDKTAQEPLLTPDVSSAAFHSALEQCKPEVLRNLPGLQELATALWQRRSIPSASGGDAVMHIFTDYDANSDGVLSATEVSEAFRLHNVHVSPDKVEQLLSEYLGKPSASITRDNWPGFVHGLAVADLYTKYKDSFSSESSMDS